MCFTKTNATIYKKRIIRYPGVLSDLKGGSPCKLIALAANKIIAHPTSLTGSIGVIAMKVNIEGLMEKIGVEMEIVKSGEFHQNVKLTKGGGI